MRRQFRKKSTVDIDDEGEDVPIIPQKQKTKQTKAKSLGIQQESDEVDIKAVKQLPKHSSRQRLKPKQSAQPANSTQISRKGEYTPAKLQQLQSGQRAAVAQLGSKQNHQPAQFIKLTGSFKAPSTASNLSVTAAQAPRQSVDKYVAPVQRFQTPGSLDMLETHINKLKGRTNEDIVPIEGHTVNSEASKKDSKQEHQSRGPPENKEEADQQHHFPDEQMIRQAKQRRERLRQAHIVPAYTRLTDTTASASLSRPDISKPSSIKPSHGSPLNNSDNSAQSDDGYEDDQNMRLKFSSKEQDGNQRRADIMQALKQPSLRDQVRSKGVDESACDDDDWITSQLQRGLGVAQSGGDRDISMPRVIGRRQRFESRAQSDTCDVSGMYRDAMMQLEVAVQRAKERKALIEKKLESNKQKLQNSKEEGEMQQSAGVASGSKYEFMQKMKAYVQDLGNCLQDKSPLVDELWDYAQRQHEQYVQAVCTKHSTVMSDMSTVCQYGVQEALTAMGGGSHAEAAGKVAQESIRNGKALAKAIDTIVEQLHKEVGVDQTVDEFGRDLKGVLRSDAKERLELSEHQREQGHKTITAAAKGSWQSFNASVQDLNSLPLQRQLATYNEERIKVLSEADTVMGDADKQFGSIQGVLETLEQWKTKEPGTWKDAYVQLNAPAMLLPFVKLELAGWDPLTGCVLYNTSQSDKSAQNEDVQDEQKGRLTAVQFRDMDWFVRVQKFDEVSDGSTGADKENGHHDEAVQAILPAILESVVFPIVLQRVKSSFEPRDSSQTANLLSVVTVLQQCLAADHPQFQQLERATADRLDEIISQVRIPPWPPAVADQVPEIESVLICRFVACVQIMQTLAVLEPVLDYDYFDTTMYTTVMGGCIVQYLRNHQHRVGLVTCATWLAVSALPPTWWRADKVQSLNNIKQLVHQIGEFREFRNQSDDKVSRLGSIVKKMKEHVERA